MPNPTAPVRTGAIWARVSSDEQHPENYLPKLERWAADRGVDVKKIFLVNDSASLQGLAAGKGADFDAARDELVNGARLGTWNTAIIWSLDRLSRRGYKDLSALIDKLATNDCELWSYQEPWLQTIGPVAEIVVHLLAWIAKQQMDEHSAKIKLGMARARAEGKQVGGRRTGAKDKRRSAPATRSAAVAASWAGPAGDARRQALAERNRGRTS